MKREASSELDFSTKQMCAQDQGEARAFFIMLEKDLNIA